MINCKLCGKVYQPKIRKNSSPFCSKSCRSMFQVGRQPGPKRQPTKRGGLTLQQSTKIERNKNRFKVCTACNIEKDYNHFFNEGRRYWSICKECHFKMKECSWREYISNDTTFSRCYKLLIHFKRKGFYLDYIDLLRLIDMWDQIYPNDVPHVETDFNWILNRVNVWYQSEKERIGKEEL